jgi:hypothetical protein
MIVTDASMEGRGAVLHIHQNMHFMHLSTDLPQVPQKDPQSVPARGLLTPEDAETHSINQRELLADIIGVRSLINFARNSHVSLTSDSQVALAVTRKWTSKSPQIMALIHVLRQLCEVNSISLGLQYLPSILNKWENQLSRSTPPETNAGSNIEKIICRLRHDLAASFMVLLTHRN